MFMTPLVTPIFYFHLDISSHMSLLMTVTQTLSLVKTSLKSLNVILSLSPLNLPRICHGFVYILETQYITTNYAQYYFFVILATCLIYILFKVKAVIFLA